ncbi:hypothetical protein H5410_047401 [Solanum commersonii]|uniref:Uncharacterized protein n=1 Tax=Solanum commersonii TaxID=4109 RepID=A0A9J5XH68_SOLCO|nr:hypothetical protein H5410_047401 [Solanum commersonii]
MLNLRGDASVNYQWEFVTTDHSASLVEIVDQLGDLPFGRFHRRLALSYNIVVFWIIRRNSTASRNCSVTRRLLFSTVDLILSFKAQHTGTKGEDKTFWRLAEWQTQVQLFKKGISNRVTQDSIMNAHNKTQFTYAKIKCALKDSSCDSPISKYLMLTILASNTSSSSTKVFKCPHTRNDSIFTHKCLII